MIVPKTFRVVSISEVEPHSIAEQFAELDSTRQMLFIEELFDALKHKCGDQAHFERQLWHIAKDSKKGFHRNLSYVFETLHEFEKDNTTP